MNFVNIPFNAKNLQLFSPSLIVLDVFQELLSQNNCNFYVSNNITGSSEFIET